MNLDYDTLSIMLFALFVGLLATGVPLAVTLGLASS